MQDKAAYIWFVSLFNVYTELFCNLVNFEILE